MKSEKQVLLALALIYACGLPDISTQPKDVILPQENPFEPKDNYVPQDGDAPGFAITSVEPSSGPVSGGTRVTVRGFGFLPSSKVIFGGSEGLDVVVKSSQEIRATTPPHEPGPVTVHVFRPDGKVASLEEAFYFVTPVTISDVVPSTGPALGGTPIMVRGAGFLEDTRLIVGGRLAGSIHVLDSSTLLALTPPGGPGPRDVTVVNEMGSAVAKRAFHYAAPPEVFECTPVVVEVGHETEVLIRGKDLEGVSSVVVEGAPSMVLESFKTAVKIRLWPKGPGPLDVTVTTPGGSATLKGCLFALTEAEYHQGTPKVFGVSPPFGHSKGGYTRRVITSGLKGLKASDISVNLGDAKAEVLGVEEDGHFVVIKVPAHKPEVVSCSLLTPSGLSQVHGAFEFVPEVRLEAISPSSGPTSGGTSVLLTGSGLNRIERLWIGPSHALIEKSAEDALSAVTGPSAPGLYDVVAKTDWGESVAMQKAFLFGEGERGLLAIVPSRGAIAGGTLVAVLGSGFSSDTKVKFGNEVATTVDPSDPTRLLVRTPPGNVGVVDVEVAWPDGERRLLPRAFTYFDPTGFFGGVFGDLVQGAVNVTVLDSTNGKPIPQAFVILGHDPSTPYKGLTDLRGQIVLSGEDIVGPVDVTATRVDYSTMTIAGADAENITIFLDPVVPTSSGSGTSAKPLPPGIVEGRVLGTDKFLLAKPGSCSSMPLTSSSLCRPCVTDEDCGPSSEAFCINPVGDGYFCSLSCGGDKGCPEGYACFPVGFGRHGCLPSPGTPEVRCSTSSRGFDSYDLNPGPGFIAGKDGVFALNSRLGDVAVYCVGGLRNGDNFLPIVLGVARHVEVYPAQVTSGVEVALDIPLDRELMVRLLNAPGGPGGANVHRVRLGLNLGSDGWIRLWDDIEEVLGERFTFHGLPRDMSGPLEGATFTIRGEARSPTEDGSPYSASILRDFTLAKGPQTLRISTGSLSAETIPTEAQLTVTSGCSAGAGGFLVGTQGRTWKVEADGRLEPMPTIALNTLRGCVAIEDSRALVVGEKGLVGEVSPAKAFAIAVPTVEDLYDVAMGPTGDIYAVGRGVILWKSVQEDEWRSISTPTKGPLHAVAAGPSGTFMAVGAGGVLVEIRFGKASPVLPYPCKDDLYTVASLGPSYFVGGAHGRAFIISEGQKVLDISLPTQADITKALSLRDGSVLVAGTENTIMLWKATGWQKVVAPAFRGEAAALVPASEDVVFLFSRDVATVGPFLHPAEFLSPWPKGLWQEWRIAWTRPSPPLPSFTYTSLTGVKSGQGWDILAEGSLEEVKLPDLAKAAGLTALPSGDMHLYSIHVLLDNFNFNAFDINSLSMAGWRSYAVHQFGFKRQ